MDEKLRRGFRIGAFSVEPLTGRITGPDGTQHVQPKVMDVLVFLAQHPGELVERDTLLEQVWRRVTSEEVLTRCISELRGVFGDERGTPSYIQTVPKRGYRLLQEIVLPAEQRPEAAPTPAATEAAGEAATPPPLGNAMASVAVLPFDNHSADPANVFMGDAFAAELHSTLARADRLRVAARRSSFVFKDSNVDMREIGTRLQVDYVISGSLQCSGPNLRVHAEVSDAKRGTQIWARSYDRKSEDLARRREGDRRGDRRRLHDAAVARGDEQRAAQIDEQSRCVGPRAEGALVRARLHGRRVGRGDRIRSSAQSSSTRIIPRRTRRSRRCSSSGS